MFWTHLYVCAYYCVCVRLGSGMCGCVGFFVVFFCELGDEEDISLD